MNNLEKYKRCKKYWDVGLRSDIVYKSKGNGTKCFIVFVLSILLFGFIILNLT